MDLSDLLKKTEQRSNKIKNTRTAPSVATDDRPYTNDLDTQSTIPTNVSSALKSESTQEETENETKDDTQKIISKRNGPVLINDLLPKLAKQSSQLENVPTQSPSLEAAKNAYQFISDGYKSSSKVVANRKQSGSKDVVKVVANNEQTVSKVVATNKSSSSPFLETVSATVSSSVSKVVANNEQTVSKVVATNAVSALVGLQRSILFLIFNECQLNRAEISSPLSLEHVAAHCDSTEKTVKNAIYRLIQKRFISRAHYKDGRGGWTQYKLSKTVFQDILHYETVSKVEANRKQTISKVVAKVVAQPEADFSSSSSYVFNKDLQTTTTDEPELHKDDSAKLPPEWAQVDCSPLSDIGFTKTHLLQIFRQGKLSATEVQDSIHFFVFDLKRNGKGKELNGPPLNFFMGILRKCIPYAPPENFESPVDEARRKTLEFKARKELERQAEEQQLLNLEFNEWRRGLSESELLKLLPDFARKAGPIQDSALKVHFENNVWPERAQDLLGLEKLDRAEISKQLDQAIGETTR